MKLTVLFLFALMAQSAAFAGYDCRETDGTIRVQVSQHLTTGYSATFSSPDLSQHYKDNGGLNITRWSSAIDPDTGKPAVEVDGNTFSFLLKANSSQAHGAVWGMELNFNAAKDKACGSIIDSQGIGLDFDLVCVRSPDVE